MLWQTKQLQRRRNTNMKIKSIIGDVCTKLNHNVL